MERIDGAYLYALGGKIRPLANINQNTLWDEVWLPLYIANSELDKFINESIFVHSVRTSRANAIELLTVLKELIEETKKEELKGKPVGGWDAYRLDDALKKFEAVMNAEFGLMPLFLITPKKGYDLMTLIYFGANLFPADLEVKVPDAITDIVSGTQCLAFEAWTAAAFHFHRATESVLRKYWESVAPGVDHPGNKTIGDYLKGLSDENKGSPKVKATLRDLKDLYRNPVLHPEYSLSSLDEAHALMGSINAAMVQMLLAIPAPD